MMDIWHDRNFGPMLLKEINNVPIGEYIYEIKFDGIRTLLFGNKNGITLKSRNNHDMTNIYPELNNIKELLDDDIILDGEIIRMRDGHISFEELQKKSHLKNKNKIKKEADENPVTFVAFDILYKNKDLTYLPLEKRKKILDKIKENDYLIKSRVYNDGKKLFNTVKKLDIEGIVAKEKTSKYEINTRSFSWIKIKNYKINDFYIGGYENKKGNYVSLKLGEYRKSKLHYVGSVTLLKNTKLFESINKTKKIKKTPFCDYSEEIVFLEPRLKCKVKYIEMTYNGHLRQPVIVKE